jgi:hypothetical protein
MWECAGEHLIVGHGTDCWGMTIPSGGGLSKSGPGRHSDLLLHLVVMVEPPAQLMKAQVVGIVSSPEAEARATQS